jgi:hypothetical protein
LPRLRLRFLGQHSIQSARVERDNVFKANERSQFKTPQSVSNSRGMDRKSNFVSQSLNTKQLIDCDDAPVQNTLIATWMKSVYQPSKMQIARLDDGCVYLTPTQRWKSYRLMERVGKFVQFNEDDENESIETTFD